MSKRLLIDLALGVILQAIALVAQYGVYVLASLAGAAPYESAPADPLQAPGWLAQISLMMLGAAPVVLIASYVLARLVQVASVSEGLLRGALWTAVVVVANLAVGFGNGTTAIFLSGGIWVLFAGLWLGPVVAGWQRGRRPAAGASS